MPNTKFKGFKQVTSDYFEQLSDSQKLGYLWFVRSNIVTGETETYDGDIYLGTRHYGRQSGDVEALEDRVNRILYTILAAISSGVGSRPYSWSSSRLVRMILLMVSIMWTGMRMVRA